MTFPARRSWGIAVGLCVAVLVGAYATVLISSLLADGPATDAGTRGSAWLLAGILTATSVATYVAWPSRWNVLAHTQLAFSVVAYVLPLGFLGVLDGKDSNVVALYLRTSTIGGIIFIAAVGVGALLVERPGVIGRLRAFRFSDSMLFDAIPRRIAIVTAASIAGLLLCFAVMGFVPAFADDPFAAKFFRGAYADAYRPVAPLYRLCTGVLALTLPLTIAYAVTNRSLAWFAMSGASVLALSLTLQRAPALSGVLLAVGVLAAAKRWPVSAFVAGLIGVYFLGSLLYALLALVGVDSFSDAGGQVNLFAAAAQGAPDVPDALTFLTKWLANPEYTYGRTLFGGLVPSNYEWNPSVWTLHIVSPFTALQDVNSGGLRLPASVWGYVGYGWPGLVALEISAGLVSGAMAAAFKYLIPRQGLTGSTTLTVFYGALAGTVGTFYISSYFSVLQLGIVVLILAIPARAGRWFLPRHQR